MLHISLASLAAEDVSALEQLDELELAQCLLCGYRARHPRKRESASSYALGALGEQVVTRALAARFHVVRTADQSAAGDLHVVHEGHRVLVEVKNYARPVPPTELDKLERDLDVHGEAAGAVIVSLRSSFTGSDAAVRLQSTPDGRPLVLLSLSGLPGGHDCAADLICTAVQVVLLEAGRRHRAASHRALEQLGFARVCASLEYISELIGQQGHLRYQLAQLRQSVNKQCDQLTEALLSSEVRIQEHLSALLDLLALHQQPPADVETPRKSMVSQLRTLILAIEFQPRRAAAQAAEPDSLPPAFCQREPGLSALTRLLLTLRALARTHHLKKVYRSQTPRYVQLRLGPFLLRFQPLRTKLLLHLVFPEDRPLPVPPYTSYNQYTITADVDRPFIDLHLDAFCQFLLTLPLSTVPG